MVGCAQRLYLWLSVLSHSTPVPISNKEIRQRNKPRNKRKMRKKEKEKKKEKKKKRKKK